MRARARWMGVFAVWLSGCAQTLVIGSMREDASADTPTSQTDVAPPPDVTPPIDRATPADTPPPPTDSTASDAITNDSPAAIDARTPDVADASDVTDSADVTDAADVADVADASDAADAPDGTPLPSGWCSVGARCYVDPGVFQSAGYGEWVDACAAPGSQRVLVGADDEAVTLTLPFEFRYVGRVYSQVGVSSNGAVGFPTVLPLAANQDLPYRPMGDALFPLWTDLQLPSGVCVATVGAAPDRRFVIEYERARRPGSTDFFATFEVVLDERTNRASSRVLSTLGAPGYPTVGYQERDGASSGTHYSPMVPPFDAFSFFFGFTTRVTEGVGTCHAGTIACGASERAVCVGMLGPSPEVCNGLDDDCDGVVDECATCGAARVCSGGRCVCPVGAACDGAPIAGVAEGLSNTCAWRTDGTVACWGRYHIGDGCDVPRPSPTAVAGLRDVAQVSMGGNHVCARRRDGTVACWGSNTYGQLGDGTTTQRLLPVDVPGVTDAAAVVAGGDNTCVYTASGATRCWGSNLTAQVGDGTTSHRSSPVALAGLTDAVTLEVSYGHTCALRATGGVACWGLNRWGGIGEGTDTLYLLTPTPVIGMADHVSQIGVGSGSSIARRDDGRLYMWGANTVPFNPALARIAEIRTPVELTEFGRVASVNVVGQAIFAWRDDGTVLALSNNMDGQVGDGGNAPVLTPTPQPQLTGMRIGRGAGTHVCALRDDGSLWCWGNNREGQIGDGTTIQRYAPVRVPL